MYGWESSTAAGSRSPCSPRLRARTSDSSSWKGVIGIGRDARRPGSEEASRPRRVRRSASNSAVCVRTTASRRATGVVHAATGRDSPSTATTQRRHAPEGARRGSWHSVGMSMPCRRRGLEDRGTRRCVRGDAVDRSAEARGQLLPEVAPAHCAPTRRARCRGRTGWSPPGRRRGRATPPVAPAGMPSSLFHRGEQVLDARGADPAGRALAARLVRAEAEHVMHELGDRGVLVEGDDATVAHVGTDASELVEPRTGCRGGVPGRMPASGPPMRTPRSSPVRESATETGRRSRARARRTRPRRGRAGGTAS